MREKFENFFEKFSFSKKRRKETRLPNPETLAGFSTEAELIIIPKKGKEGRPGDSGAIIYLNGKPVGVIIADGVGGRSDDHLASLTITTAMKTSFEELASQGPSIKTQEQWITLAKQVFKNGLLALYKKMTEHEIDDGAATTLTFLVVVDTPQGPHRLTMHLGDSEGYLRDDDNGKLIKLTRDDSIPGQAKQNGELTTSSAFMHPRRNIITRAINLSLITTYADLQALGSGYSIVNFFQLSFEPTPEYGRFSLIAQSDGVSDNILPPTLTKKRYTRRVRQRKKQLIITDLANQQLQNIGQISEEMAQEHASALDFIRFLAARAQEIIEAKILPTAKSDDIGVGAVSFRRKVEKQGEATLHK